MVGADGQTVAVTVQGARDILAAPGHPDGKRQTRCKRRDLERHGARILKQVSVTSCPPMRINKRREVREVQRMMQVEMDLMARKVAARLLGVSWTQVQA